MANENDEATEAGNRGSGLEDEGSMSEGTDQSQEVRQPALNPGGAITPKQLGFLVTIMVGLVALGTFVHSKIALPIMKAEIRLGMEELRKEFRGELEKVRTEMRLEVEKAWVLHEKKPVHSGAVTRNEIDLKFENIIRRLDSIERKLEK